jgi:hypothetical protein
VFNIGGTRADRNIQNLSAAVVVLSPFPGINACACCCRWWWTFPLGYRLGGRTLVSSLDCQTEDYSYTLHFRSRVCYVRNENGLLRITTLRMTIDDIYETSGAREGYNSVQVETIVFPCFAASTCNILLFTHVSEAETFSQRSYWCRTVQNTRADGINVIFLH